MNFEEYAGKPLLKAVGIAVPDGKLATTSDEAVDAFDAIGPCVVKAQVPTGKRGKAGGIKIADNADEARAAAEAILGMDIAGHTVASVLVEGRSEIRREYYAAVMNSPETKGPMVLFSALGGMDVEEAQPMMLREISRRKNGGGWRRGRQIYGLDAVCDLFLLAGRG